MSTKPSPAPPAVESSISSYLRHAEAYFSRHGITYTASCDVAAGTSLDNQVWSAGAKPGKSLFVGSAIKTFALAAYLRDDGLSLNDPITINDDIRSISSTVLGDQTLDGKPDDDAKLDGVTRAVNVLEAMISHSDNTATDAILRAVGADTVRDLIGEADLPSVRIPSRRAGCSPTWRPARTSTSTGIP